MKHSFEDVTVPVIMPETDDIVFDEVDAGILGFAIKWRAALQWPVVGDYCVLAGGDVRRLAYEAPSRFQVTHPAMSGAFHLHDLGTMSYSGAFPLSVLKTSLRDTGFVRSASAWLFHHGRSGAGRGVDVIVPCRVWAEVV
jgi:hypothetical protein